MKVCWIFHTVVVWWSLLPLIGWWPCGGSKTQQSSPAPNPTPPSRLNGACRCMSCGRHLSLVSMLLSPYYRVLRFIPPHDKIMVCHGICGWRICSSSGKLTICENVLESRISEFMIFLVMLWHRPDSTCWRRNLHHRLLRGYLLNFVKTLVKHVKLCHIRRIPLTHCL